jgi:predicted transcriptional regulator
MLDHVLRKPEMEIQEKQVHEVLVSHKHKVSRSAIICLEQGKA